MTVGDEARGEGRAGLGTEGSTNGKTRDLGTGPPLENTAALPVKDQIRLINATGKPIWVETVVGCLPLPKLENQPVVHDSADGEGMLARTYWVTTPFGEMDVSLHLGRGTPIITSEVPEPRPGVAYLVPKEVLLRHPHRSDFLTPHSFRVLWLYEDAQEPGVSTAGDPDAPAATTVGRRDAQSSPAQAPRRPPDLPIVGMTDHAEPGRLVRHTQPVLYAAFSSLTVPVPEDVPNIPPGEIRRRMHEERTRQAAQHGQPLPSKTDAAAVQQRDTSDASSATDEAGHRSADGSTHAEGGQFDDLTAALERRRGEHPDVAIYLGMIQRGQERMHRIGSQTTPEARAWALKTLAGSETAQQQHERVHALVDRLARRAGPDDQPRGAAIDSAEQAAMAWSQAVTGEPIDTDLATALHQVAVKLRAGTDDREPATALIEFMSQRQRDRLALRIGM
jgi:hypothetical protein